MTATVFLFTVHKQKRGKHIIKLSCLSRGAAFLIFPFTGLLPKYFYFFLLLNYYLNNKITYCT